MPRFRPRDRKRIGITEGLVRLSVGIEDERDLVEDVAGASDKHPNAMPMDRSARGLVVEPSR